MGPPLPLQMGHSYTSHKEITCPSSVSLSLSDAGEGQVYHRLRGQESIGFVWRRRHSDMPCGDGALTTPWQVQHLETVPVDLSIMARALCFLTG